MKKVKNMKSVKNKNILSLIWENKEIIFIVILATMLRTWNLNTHMIFFGDAARDLFVAANSVKNHQLPLLGIPSSVPRFHQGPLTIWMEMVVYVVFGRNLLGFGMFFAVLSVLAVIFLYELLVVFVDRKTALISAFLLSVFPLAVANGRTPYHTTPIPLFLVGYFFGLMQLWQNKKWGVFWAVLSFCLLFQFELATLPFILLIFYVFYRQKKFHVKHIKSVALQTVTAVIVGLWPQILYDLTHRFTHLGGFAIWVGYRIVSFFGFKHDHVFSISQFSQVLASFQTYLTRTWSGENSVVSFICLCICISATGMILRQLYQHQKVSPVIELATLGLLIQSAAYLVHGGPSEAYFPPFFILTAIVMGYGLRQLWNLRKWMPPVVLGGLAIYGIFTTAQILQHHFFVDVRFPFNYGYGVSEQRQVVTTILEKTHENVSLKTLEPAGKFPTYFDNLRWFMAEKDIQENSNQGEPVFVEQKTAESFPKIVNYRKIPFPSVDLYFFE